MLLAFTLSAILFLQSPPTTTPATAAPPAAALPTKPESDRYVITLAPEVAKQLGGGEAGPGRLLLFLIREGTLGGRRLQRAQPMDAPFYTDPQPLASVEVANLKEGEPIVVDGASLAWPTSLDALDGEFRVQAVYRRNRLARGHQGSDNLFSASKTITLDPAASEITTLELTQVMKEEPLPEAPNLKWIAMKSELLSAAAGRDVTMRAGVVFPKEYASLTAKRRFWPTIYVIPGFGGDHTAAMNYASMVATPGTELLAPQAVWVILDPNSPLGHHGFTNSVHHGPRADALVKEFIPMLEERFRLIAKPEARIVTGHSSGGWSSLWLQLQYPDVFGACFSSAPDPVDFSAFQKTDLYHDESMFVDAQGNEQASFRQPIGPSEDRVMMTVREEVGVEHVLGPNGDSGEQWGAWGAMFSMRDSKTKLPRAMFDPLTGAIDHEIVEHEWSRFDIARLVEADWPRYGPIFASKVFLLCGERDSYFLNRAVERLRDKIEALRAKDVEAGRMPPLGIGYVELVPRATHETLTALTTMRWNKEMIEFLKRSGSQD